MTPKERAAMQPSQQAVAAMRLALEALEEAYAAQFETTWFEIKPEHFTALREALAEPKKPEECAKGCPPFQVCDYCQKAEQAAQEPVGWYKPSDFVLYRTKPDDVFVYAPLYAAPVRTKDLTDDEIYTLYSEPCSDREMVEFARAVIAADREVNKC